MNYLQKSLVVLLGLLGSAPLFGQNEVIHRSNFEGGPYDVQLKFPEGVPPGWVVSSTAGVNSGAQIPIFVDALTFAVAEQPGPNTSVLLSAVVNDQPVFSYMETAIASVFAHPVFFDMSMEDRQSAVSVLSTLPEFDDLVTMIATSNGFDLENEEMLDAVISVWNASTLESSAMENSTIVGVSPYYQLEEVQGGIKASRRPVAMHGVGVVFEAFSSEQESDVIQAVQQNALLIPVARSQRNIIAANPRSFADDFSAMILAALSGSAYSSTHFANASATFQVDTPTIVRFFSGMGGRPSGSQEWSDAYSDAYRHNSAAMLASVVAGLLSYVIDYLNGGTQRVGPACTNLIMTAAFQSATQVTSEVLIGGQDITAPTLMSATSNVFVDIIDAASTCIQVSKSTIIIRNLALKLSTRFASLGFEALVIADRGFSPALRLLASAYAAREMESLGWVPQPPITEILVYEVQHERSNNWNLRVWLHLVQDVPKGSQFRICSVVYSNCMTLERNEYLGTSGQHLNLVISDGLTGYSDEAVPICYQFGQSDDFGEVCVHRPNATLQANLSGLEVKFIGQFTSSVNGHYINLAVPFDVYGFSSVIFRSDIGLAQTGYPAGATDLQFLSAPTPGFHPFCEGQLDLINSNLHEFENSHVRFLGHSYTRSVRWEPYPPCEVFLARYSMDLRVDLNPQHLQAPVTTSGSLFRPPPSQVSSRFERPAQPSPYPWFRIEGLGFDLVEYTPIEE